MVEHRAARLLNASWLGSVIVFLAGPSPAQRKTYTGVLSDYEVHPGSVNLYVGGVLVAVPLETTITRGSLDLPGTR